MTSNTMKILGAAALFSCAVNGHMIMGSPQPFGNPDNSPLNGDGSNYPCKIGQGAAATGGQTTELKAGSSQTVSFVGSAVHGGGSCQFSLSKDTAPTAGSSFKVIHSVVGDCPTAPVTFQIPADVPSGKYTFAWTWFNEIGNREMYMNCAAVSVSGGSGSDSSFSALPEMAVYNIASKNACKTEEGTDVDFPNPGKSVQRPPTSKKAKAPVGSGCDSGSGSGASNSSGSTGSSGSSGSGSSGSSSGSSGSFGEGSSGGSATSSANNGQYTGVGAGSGNSGAGSGSSGAGAGSGSGSAGSAASGAADSSPTATSFATVYTTAGTAAGSVPTGTSSGTSGAGNGTSTSSSGSSSGSGSDTSGSTGSSSTGSTGSSSGSTGSSAGATDGGSCANDGAVVCSADGTQFGLCNHGSVVMMAVAAGTKCSDGAIMRRSVLNA